MSNNNNGNQPHQLSRRKFLDTTMRATVAGSILTIPSLKAFAKTSEYTVQNIIDLILKEIPGAPLKQTVDTLKTGTADQKVTGVVTTMFATVDVIRKAKAIGANFIIAHEPTFYNHTDDLNWAGPSAIVTQKQELLKQLGIAVWRFHDYWHTYRPDGVMYGVLRKTDWIKYNEKAEVTFTMPPKPLKQIAEHLKKSLGIEQLRVIGELSASCEKIALLPGASGGQRQIGTVEKEKPDVIIIGEVHEWETAEYIRDARSLGSKTALIILGHSVSEEPGMEWLVDWLQPKVKGINVTHIASNNPFAWL